MNILMERENFDENRSVPRKFMWDIEYSVIMNDVIKSFDCIFSPYHAKYFMYYTSPKFYPVELKSVFSISVANSVDPNKMASERNQLIRI